MRRGLLKNASHEPSRVRCGPNQVTRSVCAKMIGTAQVIDLLGGSCGRRSEDPQHQTRQCVPSSLAGRVFP